MCEAKYLYFLSTWNFLISDHHLLLYFIKCIIINIKVIGFFIISKPFDCFFYFLFWQTIVLVGLIVCCCGGEGSMGIESTLECIKYINIIDFCHCDKVSSVLIVCLAFYWVDNVGRIYYRLRNWRVALHTVILLGKY